MIFEKQILGLFRSKMAVRNDNAGGIFYFGPQDFPGLQSHPYTFKSQMGHGLKGYFYHYDNPIPGRVVVFDHGMGNGHRAYMREIEELAKGGFLVFSYDHTGCMESGGESTISFAQSLRDLDDCITALKAEPGLAGYTYSVMGHSWGGFSTMNIVALHPDITHVVSMSGFISVEQVINQSFSGVLKAYRKTILEAEMEANPKYSLYHAVQSLSNTNAKVLLIYSSDDKMVSREAHFDVLKQGLAGKENIQFLLVDGKGHNPSYTADAVTYKDAFFADFQQKQKKKLLQTKQQQKAYMDSFDWYRMTQQDQDVWKAALDCLKAE